MTPTVSVVAAVMISWLGRYPDGMDPSVLETLADRLASREIETSMNTMPFLALQRPKSLVSWKKYDHGPVTRNGFQFGEDYDARKEVDGASA